MAQPAAPPPDKVRELLAIMDDPEVRAWLQGEAHTRRVKAPSEATIGARCPPLKDQLALGVTELRQGGAVLLGAAAGLPDDVALVLARVRADLHDRGFLWAALLVSVFAACGFLLEYAFKRGTRGARRRVLEGGRPVRKAGSRHWGCACCWLPAAS